MKRLLSMLLCLLLLAGCTTPQPPADTAPPQTTAPTEPTQPTIPEPTISPEMIALRENLPVMDGSTSLIPLEAGIRAALFGISQEEATAQVAHSSTWGSFHNLLDGAAELIFSCPLSQEQWDIAAERGIDLEAVPVAMEGFVFVVNAKNPVDTLTQQQLKDIYSGKITNWKQLGGEDLPIIPYQRNYDSGSQNYMIEFMGDTPLMDAPVEMRPASMEGLMDVVAVNDNAAGAIGYSVYAYAADMYGNGNEIKFIRVDGVAPDKQTMASGEYPLLGKNYAIFRSDAPENGSIRSLVRWITSYDGQYALARAGYVTLEDIGFDYKEQKLSLWQGTGTGPAAGEPDSILWRATQVRHGEWGDDYFEFLPLQIVDGAYRITGLADAQLTAEVNAFIEAQMEWIPEAHEAFAHWVQLQDRGNEAGVYSITPPWQTISFLPEGQAEGIPYTCLATAQNGYLSVAVSVCGSYNMMDSDYVPYRTETATWDLLTGKRLAPEDLFCKGVDIGAVLNEKVRSYSMTPFDYTGLYPNMKLDFAALPQTGWHLTHDAIYIDQANPYFANGVRIPLTNLPDGILAADQARDFTEAFDHESIVVHPIFNTSDRDIYYAYNSDGLVSCGFLKESAHPNAAKINKQVMDHLNTHFTLEAITGFYTGHGISMEDVEVWILDWSLQKLGSKYLLFQGTLPYHMTEDPAAQIRYPHKVFMLFDLKSGREISWTVLLKEGWQEAARDVVGVPNWEPTTLPDGEPELQSFYIYRDGSAVLSLLYDVGEYSATIPRDYVNYG